MKKMKTFRDLYSFPLHTTIHGFEVYDDEGTFVFQFDYEIEKEEQKHILAVINGGKDTRRSKDKYYHKYGDIFTKEDHVQTITIRGWGRLTSPHWYNLIDEEAMNVQDTFAEYIVKQLNK